MLAVIDGDTAAQTRALRMLLDDDGHLHSVVMALCQTTVRIEPRIRTASARSNALEHLALLDVSFKTLTGRH
jgi:hypothetical protein